MSKLTVITIVFLMTALVAVAVIAPIVSFAAQALDDTGTTMSRASQMRQLAAYDAGSISVEEASVGITQSDIDTFCRVYSPTGQMVEFCPTE